MGSNGNYHSQHDCILMSDKVCVWQKAVVFCSD